MSFDPERLITPPLLTRERILKEKADSIVNHMEVLHAMLQENMTAAQLQQEDFANRTQTLAPAYQVGDLVWLSTKNIRTTRPSKKLDHKNEGPF